jgi:hypothetical protein
MRAYISRSMEDGTLSYKGFAGEMTIHQGKGIATAAYLSIISYAEGLVLGFRSDDGLSPRSYRLWGRLVTAGLAILEQPYDEVLDSPSFVKYKGGRFVSSGVL